jgi:hypothetical protein
MSMALIRKKFELVLVSVSRSFWTLQDNVFSSEKDCSCLCRDQSKLSKRMSQKVATETHSDPDTPDEADALAAGAGGHLRAAQRASDIPHWPTSSRCLPLSLLL